MRHTITALQTTLKEVMQESREHVVCVARPIVIGLRGSIMTQHLVKGAAMTSFQQQECCSVPPPTIPEHRKSGDVISGVDF